MFNFSPLIFGGILILLLMKTKFHNGRKILRQNTQYNYKNSSDSVVVPNRTFTVRELALRLQNNQDLPNMTIYQSYENTGLQHRSQPTDLISAEKMINELKSNINTKEDLLKQIEEEKQKEKQLEVTTTKVDENVS